MAPRQHLKSQASSETAPTRDFRVGVHDIAHCPGVLRRLRREVLASGLAAGPIGVPEGQLIELDLRLEGVGKGVVVEGFVSGAWAAECSRCLTPMVGPFSVEVRELFEDEPVESETYRLDGDQLDLEPLVRDAVLPEVPVAPVCADDCAGLCPLCGVDRNTTECACTIDRADPRWAALDQLQFDSDSKHRPARAASES